MLTSDALEESLLKGRVRNSFKLVWSTALRAALRWGVVVKVSAGCGAGLRFPEGLREGQFAISCNSHAKLNHPSTVLYFEMQAFILILFVGGVLLSEMEGMFGNSRLQRESETCSALLITICGSKKTGLSGCS